MAGLFLCRSYRIFLQISDFFDYSAIEGNLWIIYIQYLAII